jgi:hypothetical protein
MKIFGKKCLQTLEIHCRTNIVEVFGKTKKPSKIRLYVKDKGCFGGFRGLCLIENKFL